MLCQLLEGMLPTPNAEGVAVQHAMAELAVAAMSAMHPNVDAGSQLLVRKLPPCAVKAGSSGFNQRLPSPGEVYGAG